MIVTNSAAETRALGERLAKQLKAGDVILLEGELGAGKSELARGVAIWAETVSHWWSGRRDARTPFRKNAW